MCLVCVLSVCVHCVCALSVCVCLVSVCLVSVCLVCVRRMCVLSMHVCLVCWGRGRCLWLVACLEETDRVTLTRVHVVVRNGAEHVREAVHEVRDGKIPVINK